MDTPHTTTGSRGSSPESGDDAVAPTASEAGASDPRYLAASRRMFSHAPSGVAFAKTRKRLTRLVAQAIGDFAMGPLFGPSARLTGTAPVTLIGCRDHELSGEPDNPAMKTERLPSGDRPRWLVCISGGKDSHALLAILIDLVARGDLGVDLLACNLDQAQPGFPTDVLPNYFAHLDIPHRIIREDTYSRVIERVAPGRTMCSLCSRYRRAILYRVAREEGCEAIVLGHHADDILETFLLNLFHGGRLEAMPPKLLNEDGDVLCLRPLAYAQEADIARFSDALKFPIIPCDLCGSQDGLQRQVMKRMLAEWEAETPGRKATILRALAHTRPAHLLDRALFDFAGLSPVRDVTG